ncbi:hypothetical protein [Desulfurococcus amylolyticus]|uniref:hypothetical protein n=1 Tax=Desulfurococcus amylolyticus TaxID=94694 RepID=UPI000662194E|nr:hypothetical protein [Desulfurococcus amylolyticus]
MDIGIAVGAIAMAMLDMFVPHKHIVEGYEYPQHMRNRLRKAILVAITIAIHNIPKRLAVGATTVYSIELDFVIALAIENLNTKHYAQTLSLSYTTRNRR